MSRRVLLWLRLTRRFGRARSVRRSAVPAAVGTTLLIGMFIVLRGLSLSGEQVVERDFGQFTASVPLGDFASPGPGEELFSPAAAARLEGSIKDSMIQLLTYDLRPDNAARQFTVYLEAEWTRIPYPGRFELVSGRWPNSPGEAVVTDKFRRAAGTTASVAVLSGNARLDITGLVVDRYGESSSKILAAAGTWASFDNPAIKTKFPNLAVSATALWNGAVPADDLDTWAAAVSSRDRKTSASDVRSELAATLQTADQIRTQERRTWIDRLPLAYQGSAFALPVLVVLVAFGTNFRRMRSNLAVLRAVGVRRHDATLALVLAGTSRLVLGVLAGVLAGLLAGAIGRIVAASLVDRPLSAFGSVIAPAGQILGLTVLTSAACAIVMARQQRAVTVQTLRSTTPSRSRTTVRRILSGVLAAVLVVQIDRLDDMSEAMVLVSTLTFLALLTVPDLVALAGRIPASSPRRRLAFRRIAADRGRTVAAISILTAVLGPVLAMVILVQSLAESGSAAQIGLVAPRQLVLTSPEGLTGQAPKALVAAISPSLRSAPAPDLIGYLTAPRVRALLGDRTLGTLVAVESVDAAARLKNAALSPEQRKALESGGIIVWDGLPSGSRVVRVHRTDNQSTVVATTPPIPAASAPFQRHWQQRTDGIVLLSTAQQLRLPVSRSEYVFTGISPDLAVGARTAAIEAGWDPGQILVPQPPEEIVPAPAYVAGIIGLGLLMLLIVGSVARTQASALRGQLGSLIALGLSTRWARSVLLLEMSIVLGVGAVLGMAVGIVPLLAANLQIEGLLLAIPWDVVTGLLAAFVAAGLLATAAATAKLQAVEGTRQARN